MDSKEATAKRKQRSKKGHVVRITNEAWSLLRERGETISSAVDGLINENIDLRTRLRMIEESPSYFILPKSKTIHRTLAEAKGEAIFRAARRGQKQPEEAPIEVREVV